MEPDPEDDDHLLRQCQAGEEAALALVVERFQERFYRLALRVLGDPGRAEDATADALANVWFRCGSWRGDSSAGTWLHQVALRTVLDHARQRRRWWRFWESIWESNSAVPDRDARANDPAVQYEQLERSQSNARQVAAALRELSPDERALVHLHYFEQQPLAEIAAVMGVSRDALKMRLSRVRQQLRDKWQDHET